MWIVELLAGMFLAYYLINKDFRNLFGCLFYRQPKRELPKYEPAKVIPAKTVKIKVVEPPKTGDTVKTPDGVAILTSDEEISRWFSVNPELAKLNEVKK